MLNRKSSETKMGAGGGREKICIQLPQKRGTVAKRADEGGVKD
jgi:hypothetical protein